MNPPILHPDYILFQGQVPPPTYLSYLPSPISCPPAYLGCMLSLSASRCMCVCACYATTGSYAMPGTEGVRTVLPGHRHRAPARRIAQRLALRSVSAIVLGACYALPGTDARGFVPGHRKALRYRPRVPL
eukprot:2441816-Rhodomonas_salina.1